MGPPTFPLLWYTIPGDSSSSQWWTLKVLVACTNTATRQHAAPTSSRNCIWWQEAQPGWLASITQGSHAVPRTCVPLGKPHMMVPAAWPHSLLPHTAHKTLPGSRAPYHLWWSPVSCTWQQLQKWPHIQKLNVLAGARALLCRSLQRLGKV